MNKKSLLVSFITVAIVFITSPLGRVSAQVVGPISAATLESLESQLQVLQEQVNKILGALGSGATAPATTGTGTTTTGGGGSSIKVAVNGCGDMNKDGQLTQVDADLLSTYLFSGGTLSDPTRADINGDGGATPADLAYFLSYIYSNGPAPKCPAPVAIKRPALSSCGDYNNDKFVSEPDITFLKNFVFLGKPAPADPKQADINGDGIYPTPADLVSLQLYWSTGAPAPKCTAPAAVSKPALTACGDFDNDKLITQSDIDFIVNFTFKGTPSPIDQRQADVNGDGVQTPSDVVSLMNYLFANGPAPSCPAGFVTEYSRPTANGCGDYDGDGFVKQADADALRSFIFGGTPVWPDRSRADVNGDESLTASDVVYLDLYFKSGGAALKCPATAVAPPKSGGYVYVDAPLAVGTADIKLDNGASVQATCRMPQLTLGSQNNSVALLQAVLEKDGSYPEGLVTGYYGSLTQKAVQAFQGKMGLPVLGAVDVQTAAIVDGVTPSYYPVCATSKPAITSCGDFNSDKAISQADVDFMKGYTFAGTPAPTDRNQADINGDGTAPTPADFVSLISYLYSNGPAPKCTAAVATYSRPAPISGCGDMNGDKLITPSDVETVTSRVFGGSTDARADVDGSGALTPSDIVYLQNYLYSNGPDLKCPASVVSSKPAVGGCGDYDGDNLVTQSDVTFLNNYVFTATPSLSDKTRADVNGDSAISPSDTVYLQQYLFSNGAAPKCPAPVVASKAVPTSCGDFNADRFVTQSDIDFLQGFVFNGTPIPNEPAQADINGDGIYPTPADLVALQSFLFSNGPAPKCTPPVAASRPVSTACGDYDNDRLVTQADIDFIVGFTFKGLPIPSDRRYGDVNGDGAQTPSDVVYLMNYLYANGPTLACPAATEASRPTLNFCGDFNRDGLVTKSDIDFMQGYTFYGSPVPTDKTRADVNGDGQVPTPADFSYLQIYLYSNGPALVCPAPVQPTPSPKTLLYLDANTYNTLNGQLDGMREQLLNLFKSLVQ